MANRPLLVTAAVLILSIAVVEGATYKKKIVGYEDGVGGKWLLYSKTGKAVTGTPTAGDTSVFLWTFRSTSTAKIGTVTANCLYTTSTINICTIIYRFSGGSITATGEQNDKMKVNEFAIVGGTGKYVGAQGYLKSTTISKQRYYDEFYLK